MHLKSSHDMCFGGANLTRFWTNLRKLDFGIIWNNLENFGMIWNNLEKFGKIGIFWNNLEYFGIIWNFLE